MKTKKIEYMSLPEALEKLKENPTMRLRHTRWYTREYIYFKDDKYYEEGGREFTDELQGYEMLSIGEGNPNGYSLYLKGDKN